MAATFNELQQDFEAFKTLMALKGKEGGFTIDYCLIDPTWGKLKEPVNIYKPIKGKIQRIEFTLVLVKYP